MPTGQADTPNNGASETGYWPKSRENSCNFISFAPIELRLRLRKVDFSFIFGHFVVIRTRIGDFIAKENPVYRTRIGDFGLGHMPRKILRIVQTSSCRRVRTYCKENPVYSILNFFTCVFAFCVWFHLCFFLRQWNAFFIYLGFKKWC